MALTKISTNSVKDQNIDLTKLPHGDANNDGKFLRANNGADPSFETVSIPAGTTINNQGDNRVITGDADADTLNAEANLTYTGANFGINDSSPSYELVVKADDANQSEIQILAGGNGKESNILFGAPDDDDVGAIKYDHNGDHMKFTVGTSEIFRANSNGICIGGTGSSNALDDYEYGTFTPTCAVEGQSNASLSVAKGLYVKVGKTVHVWFEVEFNGTPSNRTTGNAWEFGGFPFLSQNDTDSSHNGLRDYRYPLIAMGVDTSATYGTTGHFILRLNDNAQGGRIEWLENISNIRNASLYIQDGTSVQFGCTYPTSM